MRIASGLGQTPCAQFLHRVKAAGIKSGFILALVLFRVTQPNAFSCSGRLRLRRSRWVNSLHWSWHKGRPLLSSHRSIITLHFLFLFCRISTQFLPFYCATTAPSFRPLQVSTTTIPAFNRTSPSSRLPAMGTTCTERSHLL